MGDLYTVHYVDDGALLTQELEHGGDFHVLTEARTAALGLSKQRGVYVVFVSDEQGATELYREGKLLGKEVL